MPKKFDRCVSKVRKTNKKVNAYAVCTKTLKSKTQKLIDKVYDKYNKATNMTYTELLIWSKKPLSKQASLDRRPVKRNLRLLKKNKSDWNLNDVRQANKVISYLARAKKIKRKQGVKRNELTPNEIALRNWAFDVFKK